MSQPLFSLGKLLVLLAVCFAPPLHAEEHSDLTKNYENKFTAKKFQLNRIAPRALAAGTIDGVYVLLLDTSIMKGQIELFRASQADDYRALFTTEDGFLIQSREELKLVKEGADKVIRGRTVMKSPDGLSILLLEEHRHNDVKGSYTIYVASELKKEQDAESIRSMVQRNFSNPAISFLNLLDRSIMMVIPIAEAQREARSARSAPQPRVNPNQPDPQCAQLVPDVNVRRKIYERNLRAPTLAQARDACGNSINNIMQSTVSLIVPGEDVWVTRGLSPQTREDLFLLLPGPMAVVNALDRIVRGGVNASRDLVRRVNEQGMRNVVNQAFADLAQLDDRFMCYNQARRMELVCTTLIGFIPAARAAQLAARGARAGARIAAQRMRRDLRASAQAAIRRIAPRTAARIDATPNARRVAAPAAAAARRREVEAPPIVVTGRRLPRSEARSADNRSAPAAQQTTAQAVTAAPLRLPDNPQAALWRARQSGDVEAARRIEAELEQSMRAATLRPDSVAQAANSVGMNGARVNILEGQNIRVVAKPAVVRTPDGDVPVGNYEMAAMQVDRQLGLDHVPTMVERQIDGTPITVQTFVENASMRGGPDWNPDQLRFFDYLIRNQDRNYLNYLNLDGRPVAIDNGFSFTSRQLAGQRNFADLMAYPQQIRELTTQARGLLGRSAARERLQTLLPNESTFRALQETGPSEWRRILAPRLSASEIDSFLERRQQLLDAVTSARQALGPSILRPGRTPAMLSQTPHPDEAARFIRAQEIAPLNRAAPSP